MVRTSWHRWNGDESRSSPVTTTWQLPSTSAYTLVRGLPAAAVSEVADLAQACAYLAFQTRVDSQCTCKRRTGTASRTCSHRSSTSASLVEGPSCLQQHTGLVAGFVAPRAPIQAAAGPEMHLLVNAPPEVLARDGGALSHLLGVPTFSKAMLEDGVCRARLGDGIAVVVDDQFLMVLVPPVVLLHGARVGNYIVVRSTSGMVGPLRWPTLLFAQG